MPEEMKIKKDRPQQKMRRKQGAVLSSGRVLATLSEAAWLRGKTAP